MIPFIRVFDTIHKADIINTFEKEGFTPNYDAYNGSNHHWFKEQLKGPHKLYCLHFTYIESISVDQLYDNFEASFFIAYDENEIVTPVEWLDIEKWLKNIFFGGTYPYPIDVLELLETPDKLTPNTFYSVPQKSIQPEIVKRPGHSFRWELLEERDTCVYEVVRDGYKPFTVVIFPFSSKGHLYFFTDIYGSKEWDFNRIECAGDYLFLQQVWKDIGLDGDFTMERVKKRIDMCYPCEANQYMPYPEPIIYRTSLEEVITVLTTQQFGKKYARKYDGKEEGKERKEESSSKKSHSSKEVYREPTFGQPDK